MFELKIFLFGCIGSIAPEIVRLYKLRYKKIKLNISYSIISVIFMLLGGVVAIAVEAKSFYAAMYNGIALPTLISTIANNSFIHTKQPNDITRSNNSKKYETILSKIKVYLTILCK
jgi:xanthine/uracil permease